MKEMTNLKMKESVACSNDAHCDVEYDKICHHKKNIYIQNAVEIYRLSLHVSYFFAF